LDSLPAFRWIPLGSIDYSVTETTPETEEVLEEIIADEARTFVAEVRRRLHEAGVRDIGMEFQEKAA
jgi:hypothetical protein